jgi:hypothetical protein
LLLNQKHNEILIKKHRILSILSISLKTSLQILTMKHILTTLWAVLLVSTTFAQSINNRPNFPLPIKEHGVWGLYNFQTSTVITEPEYDIIGNYSRWGYNIVKDGKIGMINSTGKLVVPPLFQNVRGLTNEFYAVTLFDGSLNVYSHQIEDVLLPKGDYNNIWYFKEGYFFVMKDSLTGIINNQGKFTVPTAYLSFDLGTNSNEYIGFKDQEEKYGIININTGKITVSERKEKIYPVHSIFSQFIDSTEDGKTYGLINHINNEVVLASNYHLFKPFGKDDFYFNDFNNNQFIYRSKEDKLIPLEGRYDKFIRLNNEFIKVLIGRKYGVINYEGKEVLNTDHEAIIKLDFSNRNRIVTTQVNGKQGVYDLKKRKVLLPSRFKSITKTDEGFIQVNKFNSFGLYNRNYEKLLDPIYQRIQTKQNSIKARKGKSMDIFWVDNNQKITSKESYDEFYTLRIGYSRSAIISNAPTRIAKKEIYFPPVNYEWIDSDTTDAESYRKIGDKAILDDFKYFAEDYKKTPFTTVKTKGKKVNRNSLIRHLSDEDYRFSPLLLFNGDIGEFIQLDYLFTGFRMSDLHRHGMPKMAVILEDGSFSMMDIQGNWLKDENDEIFSATYIEDVKNGMMRYAIGGEWVTDKDSLKKISENFIIPAKRIFHDFNLKQHYEDKHWSKNAYLKNAKWGYLDSLGNIAISAQYDEASYFRQGKTIVKKEEKIGCIDNKNKIIIPFKYNNIIIKSNGYLQLELNNTANISYLMNKKGQQIIHDDYSEIDVLFNDRRRVQKNNKYGAVDTLGKITVPLEYDTLGKFAEGYALASKDSLFFLVSENGEEILKNKPYQIKGSLHDELIRVQQGEKHGFIDINGDIVVSIKFTLAFDFQEGLARVVVGRKTGLINNKGTFIVAPNKYELIFPFDKNGLSIVQYEQYGTKGIINKEGTEIIQPYYEDIKPFYHGYAIVKKDGKHGYIDLSGKEIIPTTLYDAYQASEGGIMAVRKQMSDLWIFKDSSNQRLNNLQFTGPAKYKDRHSIITVVTDTLSYHRCLVNLAGDTLIFSNTEAQVYFYKNDLIGMRNKRTFANKVVKVSHHFKRINENSFRGPNSGYRQLSPFVEGVSIARPTANMGLIDVFSNHITSLKYKSIQRKSDNTYSLAPEKYYGYAQSDGKIILEPIYDKLVDNMNIIQVEKGDQIGYMDMMGDWIWELKR